DSAAVVAFVEGATGETLDDEDVASLARAIYEETDGNPFFIREVLRHLAETGVLQGGHGSWHTRPPADRLGIPEGVRDVVGRRLSRLSEAAKQTLAVAAAIAHEFDFDVLSAAGDTDD